MSRNAAAPFSKKVAEVVDFARALGIDVRDAVPLRSTNNVVIQLSPAPVVAKIGVSRRPQLRLELDVAVELNALGAPVAAPAPGIPSIVHSCSGTDVTFWTYYAQDSQPELDSTRVAAGLSALHAALARLSHGLRARLPSYAQELIAVRELLDNPASLPALADDGRRVLATTFEGLDRELRALASPGAHTVIHGSPHSYNVLRANGEALFIDFETTCTGPREWDVAHVESGAELAYGTSLDAKLLRICRAMGSVKTATFCWADPDRGDQREHAELHLEHVRRVVAPSLVG
jgi:hypothetical protein